MSGNPATLPSPTISGMTDAGTRSPLSPRTFPPSPPQDRTVAVTWGKWGGFYRMGDRRCWRVCLGFVAITYLQAEFANVLSAWVNSKEFKR